MVSLELRLEARASRLVEFIGRLVDFDCDEAGEEACLIERDDFLAAPMKSFAASFASPRQPAADD
jgi:hypothetical protein